MWLFRWRHRFLFVYNNDYIGRYNGMSQIQHETPFNQSRDAKWLKLVAQNVKSLRYGVVKIMVQDSRVIQTEKTERVRFEQAKHHSERV